jgi:hypothetical protein
MTALARQGFVCREERGCGRARYKLRFRCGGKQRVKYLSHDPDVAERVRKELEGLQASSRLGRRLGQLSREAKQVLRSQKSQLRALLEQTGYHFHGLAIRRRRGTPLTETFGGAPPNSTKTNHDGGDTHGRT